MRTVSNADTTEACISVKRKKQPASSKATTSSSIVANDQSESTFRIQFQFLDGLKTKEERKRSRSHVTAQHYRRKRFEAGRRHEHDQETHRCPDNGQVGAFQAEAIESGAEHWYSEQTDLENIHDIEFPILVLQGAQRADPFNTFPIEATKDVQELVDHYCYVIPSLVHKHWSRAVRRPRSCWELYHLYRKDAVSFLAMLHHSAIHLALLNGYTHTMQTMKLKQRALEATNQRLRTSSSPYDDATIIAVGLLANGERLWGNRESAKMHWSALKRMLADRGGFAGLRNNPAMHTKVLWSFIALSWPSSDDQVNGFANVVPSLPELSNVPGTAKLRMSCDEFTQLINQRKQQVLQGCRSHRADDTWPLITPEVSPALEVMDTRNLHPDKIQSIENCRIACLVFFNLVLADYGEASETTKGYFKQLVQTIEDEDDDSTMTSEHLLWTLLSSNILSDHPERCWKLARLMAAAKRLSKDTWTQVGGILSFFLLTPTVELCLSMAFKHWNSETFVEEIIGSSTNRDDRYEFSPRTIHPCPDGCQICKVQRLWQPISGHQS